MWPIVLWSVTLFFVLSPAWGESPAPAPTCEQQVQEQYRFLSTDNLVPQATAPQWGPQLTAIVTQLRVRSNQYELKKNQAEIAEQNWLQTNEQLRLSRQPPSAPLSATPPAPPPAPPPTN
jgi:hypothetical protein